MTTASHAAPTPSLLGVWIQAIRPRTLAAGAIPVLVGLAVGASVAPVRPRVAVVTLVAALLLQIGSNLANDLFDFLNGADGQDRLGPARAAAQGWLTPRQLAMATAAVFAAAAGLGAWLAAVAGWPIVVIGLAGIGCAVGYTAGPRPLGYMGLGDVMVFAFFGPVAVVGTVWVQTGATPAAAWAASIPIGLLTTAILVVNNLRDRRSDARAGKRTLAVRLGAGGARAEYVALVAGAYVVPVIAVAGGLAPAGWLLVALTLPLAVVRVRRVRRLDGAALNPELGATAGLLTVFGLLLAAGALLGAP